MFNNENEFIGHENANFFSKKREANTFEKKGTKKKMMIMMKGKISKAEVLCSQLPIIDTAEYAFVDLREHF